jgi:HD-like signal output (HDOD) protein
MHKARILIVDDDPFILDALRNLLRKERHRWEMTFAGGGEEALLQLAGAPYDIVLSDMRMPKMDGAELLAKVKELYPSTARMVLSAQASREAVLRAIPVAQQLLPKPCDAAVLVSVFDRTLHLKSLLANQAICDVAGKLDALPSVPQTYLELTETAAGRNSGVADLAIVIERDPAMSAKVLQLVNSAYFGLHQQVSSIRKAVSFLGVELLKGLALGSGTFAAAAGLSVEGFSIERLRDSSLMAARLARRFAAGSKIADEAFSAALVRDVGEIVLAMAAPAQFSRVLKEARSSGKPLHDVEMEEFGTSHAEIGAFLLGAWGLPFSIVEAVAFHHRPGVVVDGTYDTLAAVHVAGTLVDSGACTLDLDFLQRAEVMSNLPAWQAAAAEEIAAAVCV